jgi:hypothetical protein
MRKEGVMQISEDVVHEIVRLAEIARAARSAKHGDGNAIDVCNVSPEELANLPEEDTLKEFIEGLSEEEKAYLMAVMWLGRNPAGETSEDFDNLVNLALDNLDIATDYITDKTPFTDYLREGMRKLGRTI